MVCLINETSASDGDIFPYYFREAGLGPIIGKRSWGGVVGISDRGPLLDGGTVYVPLSATNAPDGEYIIEGHGVDPDIVVAQDPKAVSQGGDPQLERAIAEVLNRIETDPPVRPKRPADPVRPGR
jgi:tricorn protease